MSINQHNEVNYTDEDTARARQQGFSSAGMPTHPLDQSPPPAVQRAERRNDLLALALIAVGIVALLGRFVPASEDLTGGLVVFTIGSCFLFFAFWNRLYGLLIPGCILGGLGLGIPLAEITDGVSVLWGLALGFFAILFLGRAVLHVRHTWPVYPAVILFALGVMVAMSNLPAFFSVGLIWLPVLLIGAGIYLGWRRTAHK